MYVLWGQHPIKSQDAQRSKFNAAKIVSIFCVQLSVYLWLHTDFQFMKSTKYTSFKMTAEYHQNI